MERLRSLTGNWNRLSIPDATFDQFSALRRRHIRRAPLAMISALFRQQLA
jgi:hypothetical protein